MLGIVSSMLANDVMAGDPRYLRIDTRIVRLNRYRVKARHPDRLETMGGYDGRVLCRDQLGNLVRMGNVPPCRHLKQQT